MNKITIVAAMHGDETYGIDLHSAFVNRFPGLLENVQLIIGNKKAYEQKTRFIDVDMNRAYGSNDNSHELKEIKRVDQLINSFNPDYIIDIHTTRRSSGVFFISDTINSNRQRIFDMLDIDVCIMQEKTISSSLIGNYRNAVSLEYSLSSVSHITTTKFITALHDLIASEEASITNKRLYYVSKLITKDQWKKYKNLTNYAVKPEGMALMVPKNMSEMDAEYFGFWCNKDKR